jgi:hypothetical protein
MAIEWRLIAEFPNYEVSNDGQVRNKENGHIMSQFKNKGYWMVRLGGWKKAKNRSVHRLMAEAFLGDVSNKEIDHIDRDRGNNKLSNIRIVSTSENGKNKTSCKGCTYEYIEELPDGAIQIEHYGNHTFDNLFYHDKIFYVFNGLNFRKLIYCKMAKNEYYYVGAPNMEGKKIMFSLAKFRQMIGDV